MIAHPFTPVLPVIMTAPIGSNGHKIAKKKNGTTFGTKACGYCGENTKNNKQILCRNKSCRGLTPYFPKKKKPTSKGLVCPKPGCGWSTRGNRTHNCKECGTAFPSKVKSKPYVVSKKRKKGAPKGASKKRKKTNMMVIQPIEQPDGVNSCPVLVVSQNDPQSVSKHATIGIGDSFFQQMLEEFEAECPPKCGSVGRLSRENSLSYGGNLSLASLGPVSLSRGNSLSELGRPVSLSRDNSLSEFNLVEMYSGQALPDTDYTIESHGEELFKL